jgi:hypothetical protein
VHRVLCMLQREIRKQEPDRFKRYAQAERHQWSQINQQIRRMRKNGQSIFESFGLSS